MNHLMDVSLTLDSREVSKMLAKNHADLLRDISKYERYFNESKIALVEFFIPDTYIDSKGEERKCYLITKKGCEFLAHKMTGQKGAAFTARYIELFHQMEQGQWTELQEFMQSQRALNATMTKLIETLLNKATVETPHTHIGYAKEEINLEELIQAQASKSQMKMEGFPTEVRHLADTLLQQEERNFSYVSRVLHSMGYPISHTAVRTYYRQVLKGGNSHE